MQVLGQHDRQIIKAKTANMSRLLKNQRLSLVFFEVLGTLIFAFGICVSQYKHPIERRIPNIFWTFLISCFYFLGLSVSAPLSGGYLNFSASLGLYGVGVVKKRNLVHYLGSQIVGAVLGSLLYFAFFGETTEIYSQTPELGQIVLDSVTEAVGSFLFVFAVLYATDRNYMKGEIFKYFFVSLMLLASRMYTFRKGVLNPAIAIAFQLFASFHNSNAVLFLCSFALVLGSVLGAGLSVLFYKRFFNPILTQIEKN